MNDESSEDEEDCVPDDYNEPEYNLSRGNYKNAEGPIKHSADVELIKQQMLQEIQQMREEE